MKKTVAIIGGGPSALAAAAFIDSERYDVTIYEKNKTLGRKFLVAGKGGFNLTHSEPIDELVLRYSKNGILEQALKSFDNNDFRAWLNSIGISTFVGSSKRIYPEEGIKPIAVLTAILNELKVRSVRIECEHKWTGWSEDGFPIFESGEKVEADLIVFSLGGASWKVTGSDGTWLSIFEERGIKTLPFLPANCAYEIDWTTDLLLKSEGMPLKNISISSDNKVCKGEVVITCFGIEGNAIYALSPEIQGQLSRSGKAVVHLDLKPGFSEQKVLDKLNRSTSKATEILKNKLKLSKTHIHLLKALLTKEEFLSNELLAKRIKQLPLHILSAAPLDEAISTTGGLAMSAINGNFELKRIPNTYCIGEMLDWNAPTGGYLLQACFSIGVTVARIFNMKAST